ncbi:MAG: hypothetical protein A3H06_01895 [Candidatus Colwellbacteria bacterium RIFCSPLOWO2_12_FULL_44_13]|uniref:Uncharacterized protein n=2 Tax=Candidatus Colwelliibacteriota TaxID=1817904 RepID=A0A1G1Z2B8_9BACT|nr:MAG: hypothetical protein A3F24_01250 [Candidatus Colwellbacteria bacterium RIFCSPHIGHO2_12_FULL_44_17]OGY61420.1 MAG: hypothetical protein A3H06_01895 [Candidatus Colwellbacteria bacterium RIFCSPLOWO2_12_FULL_44_13]
MSRGSRPYPLTPTQSEIGSTLLEFGTLGSPQSFQDLEKLVFSIRLCSEEILRAEREYAQNIAQLESEKQEEIESWKEKIKEFGLIIHAYASKNRDELTHHGERKTILFSKHGSIGWKKSFSRLETDSSWKNVLSRIKRYFSQKEQRHFLRVKEEVNKQALLRADESIREKAGVRIIFGKEYFFVNPSKLDKKIAEDIQELLRVTS